MNEKNTEMLFRKYPKLYKTKDSPLTESLMAFGFEHSDGWFNIIDELSAKIEAYNQTVDEVEQCVAMQVKEKYGTLRFYIMGGTEEIYDWIDEAEKLTEVTCEVCGEAGKLYTDGWYSVRCDKHKPDYAS
jgi:hypothetical protein